MSFFNSHFSGSIEQNVLISPMAAVLLLLPKTKNIKNVFLVVEIKLKYKYIFFFN